MLGRPLQALLLENLDLRMARKVDELLTRIAKGQIVNAAAEESEYAGALLRGHPEGLGVREAGPCFRPFAISISGLRQLSVLGAS